MPRVAYRLAGRYAHCKHTWTRILADQCIPSKCLLGGSYTRLASGQVMMGSQRKCLSNSSMRADQCHDIYIFFFFFVFCAAQKCTSGCNSTNRYNDIENVWLHLSHAIFVGYIPQAAAALYIIIVFILYLLETIFMKITLTAKPQHVNIVRSRDRDGTTTTTKKQLQCCLFFFRRKMRRMRDICQHAGGLYEYIENNSHRNLYYWRGRGFNLSTKKCIVSSFCSTASRKKNEKNNGNV